MTSGKMKKALSAIVLLLAIGCQATRAQVAIPDRHFSGIECSGTMPDDLRKNLEQLYSEDRQRVRDYNNGKLTNRDRILNSSYYISQLMASARIMYGDPITRMVNRIADTLLRDYPELRRELRFYMVRSTDVNAFATGQGMVFVNMGLVAQAENEAQLAFVLSHEIVHYVRKHNLENLIRNSYSRDTTGKGLADFLRFHCRSREMESEADSLGIAMFYANSPYDKSVTDGFFDVLQYGYLPFDEVVFDTTRYNTPYYTVTAGSFLKTVAPITAREDYDDNLSTHPNLLKRRLATTRQMASMEGGKKYVVTSEKEFDDLRMLARMECIREDLIDAEYASAYYNSDVLLKHNPKNEYLRYAMAQAIYGASKYRTYSASSNTKDYRNKEGEIQQVYHFLRRCKPEELCMIAIKELWKAQRQLGSDSKLKDMMTDLMSDLGNCHNYKPDSFSATFDTAHNDTVAVESNSKYSNVKRRRRQQQSREAKRYVFTDIMEQDSSFQPLLNKSLRTKKTEQQTESSARCFIFDPSYYIFNNNTGETKIKKSDRHVTLLAEDLTASIQRNGLDVIDFSDAKMREKGDTRFYNDFVMLNDWTREFSHNMGKAPMLMETQPVMDSLIKRYNADKLALTLVANSENQSGILGPLYTVFFSLPVVTAPIAIYSQLASRQSTLIRTVLVDTRSGKVLNNSSSGVNHGDSRALIRSQQYASFQESLHGAKAPGYMGKHFAVSGMVGLSFPIFNHLFRERTDALALRWGGELEAVVGLNWSIYGDIDVGKTIFDLTYEPSTAEASITTISVGGRHYFGENIAPLGPYFSIGATLNNIKLRPTHGKFELMEENYKRWALRLEFGHQCILKDFVTLNFSACYDLTLAIPFEKLSESGLGYPYDTNPQNHIRSLNANLWIYNMFSIRMRIGLLPF